MCIKNKERKKRGGRQNVVPPLTFPPHFPSSPVQPLLEEACFPARQVSGFSDFNFLFFSFFFLSLPLIRERGKGEGG